MSHPWKEIALEDYESHMSLEQVKQLQMLNNMMYEQLYDYDSNAVMILGIAGGNGLNHVKPDCFDKVYGVDINKEYLETCKLRYSSLGNVFVPIEADLMDDTLILPKADLLIANLLIEYIGYQSLMLTVQVAQPSLVSCIIQVNEGEAFVSDSPYIHAFNRLKEVHHAISAEGLSSNMKKIRYCCVLEKEVPLPNGKKLVRLDYKLL